jgi:hypothetical protein
MKISKSLVMAELRDRGQGMRADFVDRQLPDEIDTNKHGGLLSTLNLNLAELAAATERSQAEDREDA